MLETLHDIKKMEIERLDLVGGGRNLNNSSSSSKDAGSHRLFRKVMGEDADWTLLAEYPHSQEISVYVDSTLLVGKTYLYTLTALDDDGLESKPAQAVSAKL